jgi:AraC family transcriptional regulator
MHLESTSRPGDQPAAVATPSFHFVAWDGGCLFIGQNGGVVPIHAHYALQIAFGSTPGIRFRAGEHEEWTEYAGAIIPSRQPHAMDVSRVAANVVLFVEPETREGRALSERWLRNGIAAMPESSFAEVVPPLFAAYAEQRTATALERAARRVIHVLTGGVVPAVVTDARIVRTVAHIKAHLDRPITLDEVAEVACLSPSRFRHLFVEQTGVGLRPYILWRRFLRVWELLTEGASLSTAAHAAGFADAAHLSRTSRSTFGFPPSAMQMAGPLPVGESETAGIASGAPVARDARLATLR